MKRERGLLQAFLLAMACAWASAGCLLTGFELEITTAGTIALLWAGTCAAVIFLCTRLRGGWYLAGLDLLLVLWLCADRAALHSLLSLMRVIARTYDGGYQWGIPGFLIGRTGPVDRGILLLGLPILQSVCLAVLRRRGSWLAVLLMLASLCACLVVTDTVPHTVCLFVLLVCLILLLLTDRVRADSREQGLRLTRWALIPTVLALGLLFLLNPQERYENPAKELREAFLVSIRQLPEKLHDGVLAQLTGTRTPPQVELSSLAYQPELGIPVAEAAAERSGPVYLRLRDYDRYTGTSWVSTEDRYENLSGTGDTRGAVVVRELAAQNGRLLPVFPEGDTILNDGFAIHAGSETVYRVECMTEAMSARPGANWLALPEETTLRAGELLNAVSADWNNTRSAAEAVAAYVRECAGYSRRPGAMPEGETDFALWFLESADEGFCVHFATAAAVLLRSAGIPARYVTGYRLDAEAGQTIRVTSNEAHAWVEYYDYETWTWVLLDATPGIQTLELTEPETQLTQPTPAAEPKETAPPAPTQPPRPPVPEAETRGFPMRNLLWVLGLCLAAGLIEGQRLLRIRLRIRRQRQGISNRRAVAQWQEVCLLHRLLGETPPEELEALAEKAVFSQHVLTGEELNRFRSAAARCRRRLQAQPWWKRVVYRYWFAVI